MIAELLIVGAAVSVVTEVVKRVSKQNGLASLAILVAVSLAGAFIYTGLEAFGYWEQAVGILTVASGIYGVLKGGAKAISS